MVVGGGWILEEERELCDRDIAARLAELRSGIACVKMEYGDLREGEGR